MKKNIYAVLVLIFVLISVVGCTLQEERILYSTKDHSDSTSDFTDFTPMSERFRSFEELKRTIDVYRSDNRLDTSSLRYVNYVNVIDSNDYELPLSEIFVSVGSAAVYYDYTAQDSLLINQYRKNHDEFSVEILSRVKVITMLNVDPLKPKQVPDFITNNQSLFSEIEKNGQTYYVTELTSSIKELIGWEIFWVNDGLVVAVGIPVTMELDKGLQLCINAVKKHNVLAIADAVELPTDRDSQSR